MVITEVFRKTFSLFAVLMVAQMALIGTNAQSLPSPKQEKLLNGLKVLMWPDPKADKVSVTLRIHSGAAFDPQGREGLMQMLASNLFPNASAAEFFTEDLGGSLAVETNYDYIQVDASSKPESFLTMVETLASAVSNPEISKENTQKLQAAQLGMLAKKNDDPAYIADQAVAARLFGTFPYGRPVYGTTDSVQKIEYADLLGFKQRFLTADNATIAVAGNFDRSLAMKALRRYFGGWLKSDKRSPSTFRQPEAPPAAILNVSSPKPGTSEIRFAMRGVARSDKDLPASLVFTKILENRLRAQVPAANAGDLFVRNEPHTLPGTIVIGFPASPAAGHKIEANDLLSKALSDPVTETEVQAAKADVRAAWVSKGQISLWLDADTYQLPNPEADAKPVDMISPSEVKAYAEKLRQMPLAAVLVNTPAKE